MATVGAYAHFGHPVTVELGASLRTFESVELSYADMSQEHISPLCGCWNEQEAETWRGISFASRQLTLSRSGSAPLTAYVVTAPWPGEIFAGGPWLALPSKSFGPLPASFDPLDVLAATAAQARPVSNANITTRVQYGIVVTDQPLHIRQFGPTPFGAWLPMGSSRVSLRPRLALFPTSANIVDLEESYDSIRLGSPRKPRTLVTLRDSADIDSKAEVPALDLLGTRTVLWTDGPAASVWLSEHFDGSSLRLGQAGSVVGLVVDPVFSARIAVIPTSREALARFAQVERDEMLPQPQDWLGVSEAGSVSLRLERTSDDLEEFERIGARLKLRDTLDSVRVDYPQAGQLAATGQDLFMYEPGVLRFRYPPAPPARGFSVFGAMAHLVFEGAVGGVMPGARHIDIRAPSRLEFRDIAKFKATTGVMPIAVRGGSDAFETTLAFSGVTEAWLNGEPLTRLADRFSWSTGLLAMLAGIVQATAAAFGLASGILAKRRTAGQRD